MEVYLDYLGALLFFFSTIAHVPTDDMIFLKICVSNPVSSFIQ